MQQRQGPNMVGMGMRHEDRPYILALELGQIGQGVRLLIHTHPCIDNKPLFVQFNRQATGSNPTRSP